MKQFTVIVAPLTSDGAACAALAARACRSSHEIIFFGSQRLADFLDSPTQEKLPPLYSLVICGLEVVHTDWDGRLVRPRLMDALRAFGSTILWFSADEWDPDDAAAVRHIIGEERLILDADAPCSAALVRHHSCPKRDAYADQLVRLGCPSAGSQPEWAGPWRRVINSLKDDPAALRDAISLLIEERPDELEPGMIERAERVEEQNRATAARCAEPPVPVGELKLVSVAVPRQQHAFWHEVSYYARAHTGAELCLCHLVGRPVLILTCQPELRIDLRPWARYLTDLLPAANAISRQADAVTVCLDGLAEDASLKREAVTILQDGAHLLRD